MLMGYPWFLGLDLDLVLIPWWFRPHRVFYICHVSQAAAALVSTCWVRTVESIAVTQWLHNNSLYAELRCWCFQPNTNTHPLLFTLLTLSYACSEVCIVLHKTAPLNCASSLTPPPAVSFLPLRRSCVREVDFALFKLNSPLTPQPNMAGVMMLLLLLLLKVKWPQAKEQQNKFTLT